MNGHCNDNANGISANACEVEVLPQGTILIAGGGPVGLTLATTLAYYGVRSVVLERNETTTRCVKLSDCRSANRPLTKKLHRWPKMDLTNVRSMEIFRKLGLADELRKQGRLSDTLQ